MENIEPTEYYVVSLERVKRIIKKFYGRIWADAKEEGYLAFAGHYVIRTDLTTDADAPYHVAASQKFRETGESCPLWILLSVLAYRKEIPSGRYLLKVRI